MLNTSSNARLPERVGSPFLDTKEAWRALRLLGQYAAERQIAEIAGDKFPGSLQWSLHCIVGKSRLSLRVFLSDG